MPARRPRCGSLRRRQLLSALGMTSVTVTSGCIWPPGTGSAAPRLGWVGVDNYSPEPQRFEVRIERDGDRVHASTPRVEGKTQETIPGDPLECTWGDARGPYTLAARTADTAWVETTIDASRTAEEEPVDCVIVEIAYDPSMRPDEVVFEVFADCEVVPGYEGGCSFANTATE